SDGAVPSVAYLRAIPELIAVLVEPFRKLVVEIELRDVEILESMELGGLRNAVVVRVLPKAQRGKDRIAAVDHSVGIAAILDLVVLGEREVAVWRRRLRLRREVAEELPAVVDL